MRADIRRYVVAYDVPDDRRRQSLATALSGYGDRIQYSVFIVDASPIKAARLRRDLERLMHPTEDSVLICDLGLRKGIEDGRYICLGRRRPTTEPGSYVV